MASPLTQPAGVEVTKYSPDQPRDDHGRWTNVGEAYGALLDKLRQPDGGFSVLPVSMHAPTTGFMVSIYPDRSKGDLNE